MIPESTIQEAVRRIVEAFAPERVIVFGSATRGDQGSESDLDLLVIVPRIENRRAMTIAMSGLLWGLRISCDLLVLTPEELETERLNVGSVAWHAASTGRVMFQRGTASAAYPAPIPG